MPEVEPFAAYVAGDGYEWTERLPANLQMRFRRPWNPLGDNTPKIVLQNPGMVSGAPLAKVSPTKKHSGLFLTFAELTPSEDQIVKFANEHGRLFSGQTAECFSEWEFEIRTMAFLVHVWSATKERNGNDFIEQHFKRDQKGGVIFPYQDTIMRYGPWGISRTTDRRQTVPEVSYSTSLGGWSGKMIDGVERYLREALTIRIDSLGASISINKSDGGISLTPHSLLGALWFQFADAVAGLKDYRRCEVCNTPFEVSPDVNRTSRFYCDNACRVKAYRERRTKAVKMRKRGKTLGEIKKETGSDIDTIKQWLKPKGK